MVWRHALAETLSLLAIVGLLFAVAALIAATSSSSPEEASRMLRSVILFGGAAAGLTILADWTRP